MSEHGDGKTRIDGEKLLAVMGAVPDTDRSVNPRVLREAFLTAAPHDPIGKIVDSARRASTRARQSVANDSTPQRLKARRSEGERLLAARTKEIVRELEPWIRTRRTVIFGRPEPPFPSFQDAAEWIEREAASQPPHTPFGDAALKAESNALLNRMLDANLWVYHYGITGKPLLLYYWKPDGWPGRVPVSRTHVALHRLCRACNEVAALARLPRETVTAWCLTGIRPGERIRLSDGQTGAMPGLQLVSVHRRYPERSGLPGSPSLTHTERLVLDFDVRDVNTRNLRVALREVMKWLPPRSPLLTAKQRRIVKIVEDLQGPPTPKYQRSFWTRVAKALHRKDDPSDAIAIAKLYYRAVDNARRKPSRKREE